MMKMINADKVFVSKGRCCRVIHMKEGIFGGIGLSSKIGVESWSIECLVKPKIIMSPKVL